MNGRTRNGWMNVLKSASFPFLMIEARMLDERIREKITRELEREKKRETKRKRGGNYSSLK